MRSGDDLDSADQEVDLPLAPATGVAAAHGNNRRRVLVKMEVIEEDAELDRDSPYPGEDTPSSVSLCLSLSLSLFLSLSLHSPWQWLIRTCSGLRADTATPEAAGVLAEDDHNEQEEEQHEIQITKEVGFFSLCLSLSLSLSPSVPHSLSLSLCHSLSLPPSLSLLFLYLSVLQVLFFTQESSEPNRGSSFFRLPKDSLDFHQSSLVAKRRGSLIETSRRAPRDSLDVVGSAAAEADLVAVHDVDEVPTTQKARDAPPPLDTTMLEEEGIQTTQKVPETPPPLDTTSLEVEPQNRTVELSDDEEEAEDEEEVRGFI